MDQTLETLNRSLADRYRVERAVGRGGMATVYLAQDLRHERQVAIKVLSPELTATVGAERFIREIKIAAQLSHPNILGVFDSGEAGGLLFYVMPFVEGESLRQKLVRERQLTIDEAIQITCEVAEALGFAHSREIVHRDVKPENILLQSGRALIADFGIARLAEQGAEKLTATGMAVGTAAYMSPEQSMGEVTDARADIYALGCTLYEMLAGQPPFMGANAMQIMSQHNMSTVPEIRVLRQSVPEELDRVIRRAMEKTAADRFQTMEEFKAAVLGEIPATTATLPRYTARYRTSSPAGGGGWRGRLIAGVVVAGLIGASALLAGRLMRDRTAPPDAAKLAVLYFQDETGGSLQHIADGVTEALIERLEEIPTLTVAPANGVRAFRGRDVPADSVRAAFGVGTILEGSVTRDGGQIKVAMNLFDAASGLSYVNNTVRADTAQIATLPTVVADEVQRFLRLRIGKELRLRAERGQTKSTTAWILAGRAAKLRKDADSLIGVRAMDDALAVLGEADSLLQTAQTADPRWAKLPAARALIAVLRAQLVPRKSPMEVAVIDSGLMQADAAIRLQNTNADAHEAKGKLYYLRYAHDLEPDAASGRRALAAAESTLLKAVQLEPGQATAWAALSNLHYSKPDIRSARDAAERAYKADAYLASANAILKRLFWTNHDYELFPDAAQWCETGHRRFPADPFFTECRLWMYTTQYRAPDIDDAWSVQREFVALHDPGARAYADRYSQILVAGALARKGERDSARHVLMRARTTPANDPEGDLAGNEAVVRVILGDHDVAIDLLQNFLARQPQHRQGFTTRVSPWWRDIQGLPRFRALLAGAR